MNRTKVVIIGGGFGGLNAARGFKHEEVDVLLIDKTNHHVFQPLLYQIATAALSPGDIAAPIRDVLKNQENTEVIMGEVTYIDKDNRCVSFGNGERYPYDYLIVAPGARHSYFGHDEWEKYAPGLKTLTDAVTIRERILIAFEKAERCEDPKEAEEFLRFAIIGGGPTGVEMAGAIAEIAHKAMFKNFRKIKPEHSDIYIIEGASQLLPSFPQKLGERARQDLIKLGVKIYLNTFVSNITEEGIYLGDKLFKTGNIIWAAGNQASSLLKTLDVPLDRQRRVIVGPDLTIPGHSEIFVIGDAAYALDEKGHPLPGIAPVAIQQASYAIKMIREKVPQDKRPPFKYFDKGTIATIGTAKAVGKIGKYSFTGFFAWLIWGLVHIFYLITFRNRLLVLMQWFFLYLTGSRNIRLITRLSFPDSKTSDTSPSSGHLNEITQTTDRCHNDK